MSENNEFELSNMLDEAKVAPMEIPEAKEKFIDPEDDRVNWPVIRIGHVKGLPNFQFLAAAGTRKPPTNADGTPKFTAVTNADGTPKVDSSGNPISIQILGTPFTHELRVMRGVDVPIPPSVLNMLQDTVKTEYEQSYDKDTGLGIRTPIDSPPIPYQLIKGGKYF
jgi:hypothetical protein